MWKELVYFRGLGLELHSGNHCCAHPERGAGREEIRKLAAWRSRHSAVGNSYKCDSGVCRHDDGDNQFALASSAPATVSLCSVLPHAKTVAIHPYRAAAQVGRLAMR